MKHFPSFPAKSGVGYVYFSRRSNGCFKIGSCQDLDQRRRGHKTTDSDFSYDIVRQTVEYKACEEFLKAHFQGRRKQGARETFCIGEDDINEALPGALNYADALRNGRDSFCNLRNADSKPTTIPTTDERFDLYSRIKSLCGKIESLKAEVDIIKLRLALEISDNAGIAGLISYKTQSSVKLVDCAVLAEILKVERPDLYARFWQTIKTRPFKVL